MVKQSSEDPKGSSDYMEQYVIGSRIQRVRVLDGSVTIELDSGHYLLFDFTRGGMEAGTINPASNVQ